MKSTFFKKCGSYIRLSYTVKGEPLCQIAVEVAIAIKEADILCAFAGFNHQFPSTRLQPTVPLCQQLVGNIRSERSSVLFAEFELHLEASGRGHLHYFPSA
jgi:hypothetical protein